ncbi:5'-methylthioadenosine/adenosylhomocysteine nucleosidase [Deinococcus sp. KNUC1210]|uniref:5'-methylthioadenosine/adenosylhomocysteine nucleosidase n=1 Tax=Deinococcus sp. KNUC1210 TaxID=2917691 RepID=UPI001EF02FE2|nr:5'-methylthioadenosine/adenosylhomocysteine nucleosidase [Deinococcus sp. KNUC1210]ULH15716.1 5'-methylthioadenosine/adenosylhomocysteine nucleosidase [Deinococcus sp. KNUC1210]
MIGIIGAMQEEVELLLADLQDAQNLPWAGGALHRGTLDGQDVLITVGGIGKVNAAMTTTHLLAAGAGRVIFTGVAGGVHPELKVGDIVVSSDCVQHDVDVTALGYKLGEVPGETLSWVADETLSALALEAAHEVEGVNVTGGRVVSGDVFVASAEKVAWLWQHFGAACAEMEGAAVAQVCSKHGVPFVVIRSVSDTADGGANVDYREFMPLVARHAKTVVRGMLRRLTPAATTPEASSPA